MRILINASLWRPLFRKCVPNSTQIIPALSNWVRCATSETKLSWEYETERKTFKLEAPTYYNFAKDVVDKWASKEQTGERGTTVPALWWTDEQGQEQKWSFQEISQKSKVVANVLAGPCRLSPGELIIVILPRVPDWWVINVAAIRAGVVLSPGTTLLRANDVRHRLNVSDAKCLITNVQCADIVDEVADECPSLQTKVILGGTRMLEHFYIRPGWLSYEDLVEQNTDQFECVQTKAHDAMTIFFTSGTTGAPKMAEHTHSSYGLGHLITARYFLDLTQDDILWNLSDTGWAKCAWSSLFAPWIAGACVFVQDSAKFSPRLTILAITQHPITVFCAPPTAVRFLLVEPDLTSLRASSLRHCVSGGEPVNPEMLQEWKSSTGLTLYEGYGQTETTFICGTYACIEQKPGSMGKAAPGIDLQVVDEAGSILPRGSEGELGVRYKPHRPVGLFAGYINDDIRNQNAFVGDFYLTGDRARMDDDGYIWFISRTDDVIISAGYRIGPFEVESALQEHPAVLESAVVSSPDQKRGEVVTAFVTLTDQYKNVDKELLVTELQNHCKTVTAPYKYPRKIEFLDILPKTVSGKIRRVELRNQEWNKET